MQKMPSTGQISILGAEGMQQLQNTGEAPGPVILYSEEKEAVCLLGGLGKLNKCHIRLRMVMLSFIFLCLQSGPLHGS